MILMILILYNFCFLPYVRTVDISRYTGGTVEEYYLEYTAAKNLVRFGFLKNWGVPDYATSPRPEDHPFLYTHMPPEPSLLNGLVLFYGGGLIHLRMVAAAFSALGLFFFGLFTRHLTGSTILGLLSPPLVVLGHFHFIFVSDHFIHCYYFLAFFGTLWATHRYLEDQRKIYLGLSAGFVGLACMSSVFSVIALSTTLLILALFLPHPHRKKILLPLLVLPLYLLLHLCRNSLALGPTTAFEDFFLTLQNRITGIPSRQELVPYFLDHHLVLWGVHHPSSSNISKTLLDGLYDYRLALSCIALMFLLFLGFKKKESIVSLKNSCIYLFAIIFGPFYIWDILFAHHYHVANIAAIPFVITLCILIPYSLEILKEILKRLSLLQHQKNLTMIFQNIFLLTLWVVIVFFLSSSLSKNYYKNTLLLEEFFTHNDRRSGAYATSLFETLKLPTQERVWTNLMSTVLYAYLDNPIYGPCTLKALVSQEVKNCTITFIRDWHKRSLEENMPRYYVLSGASSVNTNWADCRPNKPCYKTLVNYLETHFKKISQSPDFTVYDVNYFKGSVTEQLNHYPLKADRMKSRTH